MKSEFGATPAGPLDLTLSSLEADPKRFAGAFEQSIVRHGCAFITDHDVDPALVGRVLSHFGAFTSEPSDYKSGFASPAASHDGRDTWAQGYETSERSELWQSGPKILEDSKGPAIWPDRPAGFRDTVSELFTELNEFGARMLAGVARFLWLQDDWFGETIRDNASVIQLINLSCENNENRPVADREDEDIISLMLTDGELELEFRHRWLEEKWQRVTLTNRNLLVMTGTMLQRMTNDILKPPIYGFARDQASGNRPRRLVRFSLPFRDDFSIQSIPECVDWENYPERYPSPVTGHEFRQMKRSERQRRQPVTT